MPGEWDREDDRLSSGVPDGVGQVDWDAELAQLLEEHAQGPAVPGPAEGPWGPPAGPALVDWDDDPAWDEAGPLRAGRPRAVRMAALVVAAALILGAVGGSLGVFLHAGALPPLLTSVTSVTRSSTPGVEQVEFSVYNDTAQAVTPTCEVQVVRSGRVIGHATTKAGSALASDGQAAGKVDVDIAGPAFVGSPADARVSCTTA